MIINMWGDVHGFSKKMYKTYQVVSLMSNLTVDNFVIHIIPSQNKNASSYCNWILL